MNNDIDKYLTAYRLSKSEWVNSIIGLIKSNGSASVTDIANYLRVSHSDASQRLKNMKKVGFLKSERRGKFIFYKITGNTFTDNMREHYEYLKSIFK